MGVHSTKSDSFFRAHLLESQRLHLAGAGALVGLFLYLYQWQWPLRVLWLALVTLAVILPFSHFYHYIERQGQDIELRSQHLLRVAFIQGGLDILLITLLLHETGGHGSPVALMYLILLGSISVFYPTWQLVILNLWALAIYTTLMQAYIQGLLSPGSLPHFSLSILEMRLAPLIWLIYVAAMLFNWLVLTTHSHKVQASWNSADRQNQYLDDLNALTRLGLEHVELGKLYETLSTEIRKILGADIIYLTRWDESSQQVHPGAVAGAANEQYLTTPPISRHETSMTASVRRAGKVLVARDVFCSPYITPQLAQIFPSQSLLGVPMYGLPDHHFLGALLVAFKVTHDFDENEVEQARQLADVAALLISRTRLYHETQYRAGLLEQMAGQVSELTSDLRRTTLLPAIVESARSLLRAQRAALHLYDSATGAIKNEYSVGLSGTYLDYLNKKFSLTPEAELFREKDVVLIPDVGRDARTATLQNIIAREQFQAYEVFALKTSQGNLGMLSLYWDAPHAISSTEVSVGQLFAQRAAALLHNAELYEKITEESLTDVLTNLPNRRYFERRMSEECERSTRYGHPFALLMLDLDGFKAINDAFGHAIGDSVIKQVAGALLRIIRSSDMVARFGGDEFALIIPETNLSAAIHLAEKIKMLLAGTRLHLPNDTQRYLSACIGLAMFPRDSAEAQTLFNLADQRMYRAKRSKQGSIIFDEN